MEAIAAVLMIACAVLLVLLIRCGLQNDSLRESLRYNDEKARTLEVAYRDGIEVSERYEEMRERIDGFDQLTKHGWDSYDAKPIEKTARLIAYAMSSIPSVVPTPSGGVAFEWHRMGWDVEIEIDRDGKISGEAEMSKSGGEQ